MNEMLIFMKVILVSLTSATITCDKINEETTCRT